jgi:hypothetical protein
MGIPSNAPYGRLSDAPQGGRLIRDDWVGHMNDMNQTINIPLSEKLRKDRGCDCCRQVTAAIFFGLLCIPSACTRLLGHYTGWFNPMKVNCCGKERTIPGIELCSASDCSQLCCCDDRGYGHKEYDRPQDDGNGLSRLTLDKITVVAGGVMPGLLIGKVV